MLCSIKTSHLPEDRVDQCLPLLQALLPSLDRARWRTYCHTLYAAGYPARSVPGTPKIRSAGIITAEDDDGYIRGLFSYRTAPNLCHGRVLAIDAFVIMEITGAETVAQGLMEKAEDIGRALDCGALLASRPEPTGLCGDLSASVSDWFVQTGLQPDGAMYCKTLQSGFAAFQPISTVCH